MMAPKRRVLKLRSGAKVRSPEAMTEQEWLDWRMTDAFDRAKDKAERKQETARLKTLPSYLMLDSVFGDVAGFGYNLRDQDLIVERVRADERRKDEGGKSRLTTCQHGAIADSISERLTGYTRTHEFPATPAGKRQAQEVMREMRDAGEGELNARIWKVYCHDVDPPKERWTVWVRNVPVVMTGEGGEFTVPREGMRRPKGEGTEIATYERGREWMTDRAKAKAAIACPKCLAPIGEPCRTVPYRWEEGERDIPLDAEGNPEGKNTNPHKPRVFAYYDQEGAEAPEGTRADRLGEGHGGY